MKIGGMGMVAFKAKFTNFKGENGLFQWIDLDCNPYYYMDNIFLDFTCNAAVSGFLLCILQFPVHCLDHHSSYSSSPSSHVLAECDCSPDSVFLTLDLFIRIQGLPSYNI